MGLECLRILVFGAGPRSNPPRIPRHDLYFVEACVGGWSQVVMNVFCMWFGGRTWVFMDDREKCSENSSSTVNRIYSPARDCWAWPCDFLWLTDMQTRCKQRLECILIMELCSLRPLPLLEEHVFSSLLTQRWWETCETNQEPSCSLAKLAQPSLDKPNPGTYECESKCLFLCVTEFVGVCTQE